MFNIESESQYRQVQSKVSILDGIGLEVDMTSHEKWGGHGPPVQCLHVCSQEGYNTLCIASTSQAWEPNNTTEHWDICVSSFESARESPHRTVYRGSNVSRVLVLWSNAYHIIIRFKLAIAHTLFTGKSWLVKWSRPHFQQPILAVPFSDAMPRRSRQRNTNWSWLKYYIAFMNAIYSKNVCYI